MSSTSARPGPVPTGWPDGIRFRPLLMWLAKVAIFLGVVGAVGVAAFLIGRAGGGSASSGASAAATDDVKFWTCSMHPQLQLPAFAQCPICFMDLTPVRAGDENLTGDVIGLSDRARNLARVATVAIEEKELVHEVRLVGKVSPDETRIRYISSYIPGRLDRLYVNFTGGQVRKGDHLAEIYSPQLLVAQREYLLAFERTEKASAEGSTSARSAAQPMLEAARTRLELWGVPRDQIEQLETSRFASDHMRIDAPLEGWVLERNAYEGMYAETGTRLFTLVDLKQVWLMLAAYEQDLALLRPGQAVEFTTEAHPGRTFSGTIAYIDPTLTEATRSVKVRVTVPNADLALKPGMFARAAARVRIGAGGKLVAPALAGKWVCYMHPDVVKDARGTCDICDMELVTAESLGMAGEPAVSPSAMAVPATAVLLTGSRAIVYVAKKGDEKSANSLYEPREIQLGPRAGDHYIVLEGLSAGERIVAHGAAQIDSAIQIQGKRSMMNDGAAGASAPSESEIVPHAVAAAKYHETTAPLISAYLQLTRKLADDDFGGAAQAVAALRDAVGKATPDGLGEAPAGEFRAQAAAIGKLLADGEPTATAIGKKDIEALRLTLPPLNRAMYRFVRMFGHNREAPVFRAYCPMALDDKGAEWLQIGDDILNPYFGDKMLMCGEIRGQIAADGREKR